MSASGDIAGLLQYTHAKGRKVVRSKPAMPHVTSPALDISRAHHAASVHAYQTIITTKQLRDSWRRLATYRRANMSEYDTAMKSMLLAYRDTDEPGILKSLSYYATKIADFEVVSIATGLPSAEPGLWQYWIGPTPDQLDLIAEAPLVAGHLVTDPLTVPDLPLYFRLSHGTTTRSGIIAITEYTK